MPQTLINDENRWIRELEVGLLAAQAGAKQLTHWVGKIDATEKADRDFVTQADISSQAAIFEVLSDQCPDHQLIGEEDGSSYPSHDPRPFWLVDPLDGTTNYLHQLPSYAVSIALVVDQKVVVGIVIDPLLHQSFCAVDGGGAWLNGSAIRAVIVACCTKR